GAATGTPLRRRNRAGTVSTAQSARGRASLADMTTLRNGRAARDRKTRGTPARQLSWPKVSPTHHRALPPEDFGVLSMSTTGRGTTPLQTPESLASILLITQMTRHIVRRVTPYRRCRLGSC